MSERPHLRVVGGTQHVEISTPRRSQQKPPIGGKRRRRRPTLKQNLAAATVIALKDARDMLEASGRLLNASFDRLIDLETKLRRLSGEEC
jgi:hypothetical protein